MLIKRTHQSRMLQNCCTRIVYSCQSQHIGPLFCRLPLPRQKKFISFTHGRNWRCRHCLAAVCRTTRACTFLCGTFTFKTFKVCFAAHLKTHVRPVEMYSCTNCFQCAWKKLQHHLTKSFCWNTSQHIFNSLIVSAHTQKNICKSRRRRDTIIFVLPKRKNAHTTQKSTNLNLENGFKFKDIYEKLHLTPHTHTRLALRSFLLLYYYHYSIHERSSNARGNCLASNFLEIDSSSGLGHKVANVLFSRSSLNLKYGRLKSIPMQCVIISSIAFL